MSKFVELRLCNESSSLSSKYVSSNDRTVIKCLPRLDTFLCDRHLFVSRVSSRSKSNMQGEAKIAPNSLQRSPDLNPSDFLLLGLLKDLVYREKPLTIADLSPSISAKIKALNIQLCKHVCRSVTDRLQLCIDHEGGHFENFL